MKVSRNDIGLAIAKWEKRAKSEMYLDDFLHPKARFWLIDEIEALHAQSAPESSEVEQSRVESVSVKPVFTGDKRYRATKIISSKE